tara:strand:- start:829 stop:1125 length:297 start_codon:yes stop_codon:yes gene_type:complete
MSDNITTIVITAISVVFGAGGWKFYEFLIRSKREKEKELKSEETIYRDDLKERVVKLEEYRDNCVASVLHLNKEVAALSVKVDFLKKENDTLKIRLQR